MFAMQRSNYSQIYEDFQPLVETKETPDSLLLLVHLPGFAREHVAANYEAAFKRVRVFGERPLDNNRIKRFSVEYQVPETCDADKLGGKFEAGAIITVTLPKKPISSVAPKEEPKPAQEAAKQDTPPKSTPEGEIEKAIPKGEEGISQEPPKLKEETQREFDEKKVEIPTPPKASDESKVPQEDQEGIPQKGTIDEEKHREEKKETKETPTPPEATGESRMPQKDKGEIPQKGTTDEENQRDETKETKETSTPPEATVESRMPQKDKERISQKGKLDDEKHEEKKRGEIKETKKADDGKTSEAGKPPQKEDYPPAKKTMEENKKPTMVAAESPVFKIAEKGEMEMDDKSSEVSEGKFRKTIRESSIGKGLKNAANSASQAVTKLANRFAEEDKQKLIYVGAAILVVAVGVYASFKLRSSSRT